MKHEIVANIEMIHGRWKCQRGHILSDEVKSCPLCRAAEFFSDDKRSHPVIKNKCAACGCFINNNLNKFKIRGNFCTECNVIAGYHALGLERPPKKHVDI